MARTYEDIHVVRPVNPLNLLVARSDGFGTALASEVHLLNPIYDNAHEAISRDPADNSSFTVPQTRFELIDSAGNEVDWPPFLHRWTVITEEPFVGDVEKNGPFADLLATTVEYDYVDPMHIAETAQKLRLPLTGKDRDFNYATVVRNARSWEDRSVPRYSLQNLGVTSERQKMILRGDLSAATIADTDVGHGKAFSDPESVIAMTIAANGEPEFRLLPELRSAVSLRLAKLRAIEAGIPYDDKVLDSRIAI